METMDAPDNIWVIPDFAREFSDMPRYVHTQEYIRKDKYEELKKAADDLVRECERIAPIVGEAINELGLGDPHGVATSNSFRRALSAYRKATGAT